MTAFDSADGRALRRAVCAAPDDDLPRLVLADYLDESGDAADADRAAFIRAQCAMGGVPWMSGRWRAFDGIAADLYRLHGDTWPGFSASSSYSSRWGRGFIDELTARVMHFVGEGDGLLDQVPVRGVRLTGVFHDERDSFAEFLAAPPVARLARLDLRLRSYVAEDLPALAEASHLTGLRSVVLPYPDAGLGDPGATFAAIVRGLPGLTELALHAAPSAPSFDLVLNRLAVEPATRRLTRLDLTNIPAGSGGLTALAEAPYFAGLTRLDLGGCRLSAGDLRVLAATKTLAALEVLDLSGNPLTDADVRLLAGAAFAPSLRVLVARRRGLPKANPKRFAGLFPHAKVVV